MLVCIFLLSICVISNRCHVVTPGASLVTPHVVLVTPRARTFTQYMLSNPRQSMPKLWC